MLDDNDPQGVDLEMGEELPIEVNDEAADDELVIELEGEEAPIDETPLVKQLRQQIKETNRKLAERGREPEAEIVVGEYPELEDFDWDADKHREAVLAWTERDRASKERIERQQSAQRTQANDFQELQIKYRASAAALPVPIEKFQEADEAVRAALSDQIQIALAKYCKDPAKVVLALHKYPGRLAAITAEPDPFLQAVAILDIERNLKVTSRRTAPPPESETIQRGSARITTPNADKEEERLLAKAQKTGNMDEYRAYKAARKKKAQP